MNYPQLRLRRLRQNKILRELVSENKINIEDLIYPIFICEGKNIKKEIKSMPGQYTMSIDKAINKCEEAISLGIYSFLIFPVSSVKDETGVCGISKENILQKSIRKLKNKFSKILIIADVCNCSYTMHGHCGTIVNEDVDNDLTVKNLCDQAVSLVESGADVIAPSDMMDGRIKKIRKKLDEKGYINTPILAYSAKFSSAFYGPFREASASAPKKGDRSTYQLNYCNSREAIREGRLDVNEGSDMLMVKPALSYLDIITKFKQNFNLPIVAFNVSGEYSMVKAMSKLNWGNEIKLIMEIISSIKRAGADIIITYHAIEVAKQIKNEN
tara:strand:- start:6147 stop:7127 length:981 start_codon:yes stop_codon:yes gene_type:complete